MGWSRCSRYAMRGAGVDTQCFAYLQRIVQMMHVKNGNTYKRVISYPNKTPLCDVFTLILVIHQEKGKQ